MIIPIILIAEQKHSLNPSSSISEVKLILFACLPACLSKSAGSEVNICSDTNAQHKAEYEAPEDSGWLSN